MRAIALLLLLGGCAANPYPDLDTVLGHGWHTVPLPDPRLVPGAIVQLAPVNAPTLAAARTIELRYLGALGACGVPDSALGLTTGDVPGITVGRTYSIGAEVTAGLARLGLGGSADAAGSAALTIDAAHDASIDLLRLDTWLADPAHMQALQFAACGHFLAQPDVYVVEEAFVIAKGHYTVLNSAGGKVNASPPPGVPAGGSISGSTGNSATLTIDTPTVFAIRGMQPFSGGFAPSLAAPRAPAAPASPLDGKTIVPPGA